MLSRIQAILRSNGFRLYTLPYQLNIIGIRSRSNKPNRFDDEIHVFYTTANGKWNYHIYRATTDPGTYWLNQPGEAQGTAILAQGQYVDAYTIDRHQGKYYALCQKLAPVTVIRDYDRNAVLDFMNGTSQKGMFGINIHRASSNGTTKKVDRYSAGCQVFSNAEEFAEFMKLCEQHRKRYGNKFTYTLIDTRAIFRETAKRVVIGSTILTLMGMLAFRQRNTYANAY